MGSRVSSSASRSRGPGAGYSTTKSGSSAGAASPASGAGSAACGAGRRAALAAAHLGRRRRGDGEERARDDALDAPEDALGAARCRPYDASLYKGHPRTEAGEETIVAAGAVRRALRHGEPPPVAARDVVRRPGPRPGRAQGESLRGWRRR